MFRNADFSTLFANRLVLNTPPVQHSMVDLHGLSEKQAQRTITNLVEKAHLYGWKEIYFVTGRGKHINAKGESGTLHKRFSEWIKKVDAHVSAVKPFLGFYEVKIKNSIPLMNPFEAFLGEEIKDFLIKNFAKIKQAAETTKEVDDILMLAICYDNGYGVAIDYKKATELYLQLNQETIDAGILYEIGCRYFVGKGILQNDALAIKYYILAAEKNYILAVITLGNIYYNGTGIGKPDYILANKYFAIAAKEGHAESARKLGYSYNNNLGVPKNLDTAIQYWEQAEQLNDAVAAFNLATIYQSTRKNPEKFAYYIQRAAELGDPDGQFLLGLRFFFGFDVKPNKTLGLKWITDAANNANAQAQFFLFMLALSQNKKEVAREHLMAAAKNAHIEAQALVLFAFLEFTTEFRKEIEIELYKQHEDAFLEIRNIKLRNHLLNYLINEDGIPKAQIKKAIKILNTLATKDFPEAYSLLGDLYTRGKNPHITPNPTEAYKYLLAGSKINDVECLGGLGYYWRTGAGGKIDFKKAISFLKKAIELGSAYAHNELGLIYQADAAGALKSIKLAIEHFTLACQLDASNQNENNIFKFAAQNLALLYWRGAENCPQNKKKAIEFFSQSAKAGSVDAAEFLIAYYLEDETYDAEKCHQFATIAAKLGNEKAIALLKKYDEIKTKFAADDAVAEESKIPNSTLVNALAKISNLPFYSVKDEKEGHIDAVVECTEKNATKIGAFHAYLHGKGKFYSGHGQTFFVLPNVANMQQDFHEHLKANIQSVSRKPT